MSEGVNEIAVELGCVLLDNGASLVTAESCTGGLVAKLMTDVAGSSAWFDRAFITYTHQAKQDMLAVSRASIAEHGAVSKPVVQQMAAGALAASDAQISIAISGVAGPSGGSSAKPIGTVWFAWGYNSELIIAERRLFDGDRQHIRQCAAEHAMSRVIEHLLSGGSPNPGATRL